MERKLSDILEKIHNIRRLLKTISEKHSEVLYAGMKFSVQDYIDSYNDLINSASENQEKTVNLDAIDLKRVDFSIEVITDFLYTFVNSGQISSPTSLIYFVTESYFLKEFLYRNTSEKFNVLIIRENELDGNKINDYKVASQEMERSINYISEKSNAAESILKNLENQESEINSVKNEIITKQSSINALEVNVLSHATEVKTFLSKVEEDSESISNLLKEIENEHIDLQKKKKEISDLLENANKVGLAVSFRKQKENLIISSRFWLSMFVVGILGLLTLGICYILPLLGASSPDPIAVVTRFLIGAPLVWLTWFGARQYGHNLRIREDYAFKEATAMAFVGYRNEMSQDADMLKLLQESAIKNFASNPVDAISKKDESISPIHDLLEKSLSKIEPKQLIEGLATLLKKDK